MVMANQYAFGAPIMVPNTWNGRTFGECGWRNKGSEVKHKGREWETEIILWLSDFIKYKNLIDREFIGGKVAVLRMWGKWRHLAASECMTEIRIWWCSKNMCDSCKPYI